MNQNIAKQIDLKFETLNITILYSYQSFIYIFYHFYFRNFTNKNDYIRSSGKIIDPRVIKFHAVDVELIFSCIGGQNYIKVSKYNGTDLSDERTVKIDTMVTPTDICSDNNGHIYVSGQGSKNIHRLTQDGKVLDIPLDSRHYINQPVALCFNKNYDKLYVVKDWGKSVSVFDFIS